MRGNSHVRFLGGGAAVMPSCYPTSTPTVPCAAACFNPSGALTCPRGPWCLRFNLKEVTMEIAIIAMCVFAGLIISRPIVRALGLR